MLQQGAVLELVSEVYVGLVQSWSGYASSIQSMLLHKERAVYSIRGITTVVHSVSLALLSK